MDASSQSLFGTFVITAFTSKHSSIKQIVIWSKHTFVKILSVNMKFKLDNSSYKSKTTEEIKATANRENEILNSLHEGIQ